MSKNEEKKAVREYTVTVEPLSRVQVQNRMRKLHAVLERMKKAFADADALRDEILLAGSDHLDATIQVPNDKGGKDQWGIVDKFPDDEAQGVRRFVDDNAAWKGSAVRRRDFEKLKPEARKTPTGWAQK
jgi:hypothetical protein